MTVTSKIVFRKNRGQANWQLFSENLVEFSKKLLMQFVTDESEAMFSKKYFPSFRYNLKGRVWPKNPLGRVMLKMNSDGAFTTSNVLVTDR